MSAASLMDVFVARQPIFDRRRQVEGYELLFRADDSPSAPVVDPDYATAHVIVDSLLSIGLDQLTADRNAHLNFSRGMLLSGCATLLPREHLVIEVGSDAVDEEVAASCQQLQESGYRLALQGVSCEADLDNPVAGIADIIKVDFSRTAPAERLPLTRYVRRTAAQLLAEKVETTADYQQARELDYDLAQGFFFCRPEILSAGEVPTYNVSYLRMLKAIQRRELDFDEVEDILRLELSLSYKLLRYLNSAAFGWRHRVRSIRQAMIAMGERELRKWLSILCLSGIGEDRPRELVVQSVIRGFFCESIAALLGLLQRKTELFLTGLFSLLDAVTGRPLPDVVGQLDLAPEIREALTQREGRYGDILSAVVAYEQGQWDDLAALAARLGLRERAMTWPYFQAIRRSQEIFAT